MAPLVLTDDQAHLRRALEIAPGHAQASLQLALHLLGWLDFALHELPDALLAERAEVRAALDEVRALLHTDHARVLGRPDDCLADYDEVFGRYEAWLAETGGDGPAFADWCEARGLRGVIGMFSPVRSSGLEDWRRGPPEGGRS